MLLGFSDLGSWPALRALCDELGCDVEILRSERRQQNQPSSSSCSRSSGSG